MSKSKKITTPLTDEVIDSLQAGDMVEITGVVYTARTPPISGCWKTMKQARNCPLTLKVRLYIM